MFSNGSEYRQFLDEFCERCSKYNPSSIEGESCPIEWKIAMTNITASENDFPYESLKRVKYLCSYACRSFQSDDKELMEAYNKFMGE